MAKKVTGSSSGLYTRLSQREMNWLDQYVQSREGETGEWVPDWFYTKYDGQLRAMSPIVLTYFVAELVGKNQPYQLYPGFRSRPINLREAGYNREEHRSISHIEAGTPPIPHTIPDDPDPWATYTQMKRDHNEAQRLYYKLADKMRRRYPKDVEECDMHAKTHLDEADYEDLDVWKSAELEGKSAAEVFGEKTWEGMEYETKDREKYRREIFSRQYQNKEDRIVDSFLKSEREKLNRARSTPDTRALIGNLEAEKARIYQENKEE